MTYKWIECFCSELMQFLINLLFLWGCHGDVASICFWDCMLHAVHRIFKPYLRTLDIEHRIYRRKQKLLNLPYSPMITICFLSTVVTCVKRSQIWSNGYCLCNMFHVFLFVFFLVCFFISIKFQFLQLPALTPDAVSYHVLCCHDIHIFMVLYYRMKCWLGFACICRIVCVCVHFLHRCQYCHTRFNALVWLHVNMYFISQRHIILL